MHQLKNLLDNQFADPQRPLEDTMTALVEHNSTFQKAPDPDSILAKEKARTQALTDEVVANTTAVNTGQAKQQVSRTLTKTEFDKALVQIRDNRAGLDTTFFPATAEVRAALKGLLYPNGMDPYNHATVTTMPTVITNYLSLVNDPQNQAPKVFVEASNKALGGYAAARSTQQELMSSTDQARTTRRGLVPRVEEQFTRNLHGLCFVNADDRSRVLAYYNTALLEDQATAHPGRRLGRVDKMHTNQVLNLAEAAARYTQISLKVDEDRPLYFYRTDDPKGPLPAQYLAVDHATPTTVLLTAVPGTGALLVAHNPGTYVGHYTVQLLA